MKNSSSERKTKTHKIARNWNFIKYKSIQISTNAFLNSSDVEVDEMGWITVISHSLLYMESHIRGITQSCTSPSQPPQCPSGWAGGSAGWDYVTRLGLVWYFPDMSGWTSGPIFSGEVRFFPDIDRGTSGGDFENHAEPKKQVFRCF